MDRRPARGPDGAARPEAGGREQPLFDIFTEQGIGQATFEITDAPTAALYIKHKQSATADRNGIAAALAKAGNYRLVD